MSDKKLKADLTGEVIALTGGGGVLCGAMASGTRAVRTHAASALLPTAPRSDECVID